MPPRARRGKHAGTRFERPLGVSGPYPGTLERWEREHQAEVHRRCTSRGLPFFHDEDSRRNRSGFPDIWIPGERDLLVRELKRDSDGRVSDAQADWIRRLAAAGINVDVWWMPRDLLSGRVDNELNALLRRGPHVADLASETGKLMYLSTCAPEDVPGAAMHWDAGSRHVNRELWRKEARLLLHRAAQALPNTDDEIRRWLRDHRLPPDAPPAQVLAAVRSTLTRHTSLAEA